MTKLNFKRGSSGLSRSERIKNRNMNDSFPENLSFLICANPSYPLDPRSK